MIERSAAVRARAAALMAEVLTGGTLTVYDGPRPAPDAPATGIALATFDVGPCVLHEPGVVITHEVVPRPGLLRAGRAVWFRVTDASGAPVLDGDVGEPGSAADLEVPHATLTPAMRLTIPQLVYSEV